MQTYGWDGNLGIRELHWSPWQVNSRGLESIFLILCSFLVMDQKLDFKNILGQVIFVYILITLALFSLFRVGTFPFLCCFLSLKILSNILISQKPLCFFLPFYLLAMWSCPFPLKRDIWLGMTQFFLLLLLPLLSKV